MNDDMIEEAKPPSSSKYGLFSIAGGLAGFAASIIYLAWEEQLGGQVPYWGVGAIRVSSSYVVAIGLLVMLVVLALIIAQGRYLRQGFDLGTVVSRTVTSALWGTAAGFLAPYIAYDVLETSATTGRFLGWGFSGAFAGLIVSHAVINMDAKWGAFAGAAGGLLGCAILYASGQNLTLGMAATGALIGCALAVCEARSRRHWLTITMRLDGGGARRFEVSLGATPISVGYGKAYDVRVDAMPRAETQSFATFELLEGHVVHTDLLRNARTVLRSGSAVSVSNAVISLNSK